MNVLQRENNVSQQVGNLSTLTEMMGSFLLELKFLNEKAKIWTFE